VKSIRILVLLLVAFLLPLRGAVAASMLCTEGSGTPVTTVAPHADHDLHGAHSAHAEHADHAGTVDSHAPTDDPTSADHSGTCHVCATGCSAAPFATAPPSLDGPMLTASVTFPALAAPAPAFHCEGQERPPRTS